MWLEKKIKYKAAFLFCFCFFLPQFFARNEKSRFLMSFPHLPNGVFLQCRLCGLRMFLAMGSEEIIDCVEVELAEATLVIVSRFVGNQC